MRNVLGNYFRIAENPSFPGARNVFLKQPHRLLAALVPFLVATCVVAAPAPETIKTELQAAKQQFKAGEPVIVDVHVENATKQDVERNQFSPLSSSVGLPKFVFTRVPQGTTFSLSPGLFGDNWNGWYQPASGKEAFRVGRFVLPAGKKTHLLHGDLRLTVARAREHCQRTLDERRLLERPENAATKREYLEIVRFADEFLSGGTYDVSVVAYAQSNTVRLRLDPPAKKAPASELLDVTLRVVEYRGDMMHSSAVGPGGAIYHPDSYDSAVCEILSPAAYAGQRLQIWGWNRQKRVDPVLCKPGNTARVRCDLGKRGTPPWNSGPAGFGQWEVEMLALPPQGKTAEQ